MATFELDLDLDEASATNGWSRYAHYLTDYMQQFQDINRDGYDDSRVPFAMLAFQVATGPIMSPGLVRCTGGPIAEWNLSRSDWSGDIIGDVSLFVAPPRALARERPAAGGEFFRTPGFSAWGERYEDVGEEDLQHGPYLVSTTRVLWQIDRAVLPDAGEIPSDLRALRQLAVIHLEVLVSELNRQIDPLVAALKA